MHPAVKGASHQAVRGHQWLTVLTYVYMGCRARFSLMSRLPGVWRVFVVAVRCFFVQFHACPGVEWAAVLAVYCCTVRERGGDC